MATHLSHALLALLDRRKLTGTALGAEVGIHQVTVSRACAGERVSVDTLQALCSRQKDLRDGLELLLAHLRDEVDRAGRLQTEVKVEADDRVADTDIRLLEEQSKSDPELKAILHDLARLVRSIQKRMTYPISEDAELKAAESLLDDSAANPGAKN